MNISIKSECDFIINNVESIMNSKLLQKAYDEKVKIANKSKKMHSYETIHDEILIFMTLGFFLVLTQTMTPPVRTSFTFRGCGPKSFKDIQ